MGMWGSGRELIIIELASPRRFLNFDPKPEITTPKRPKFTSPGNQKIKKNFPLELDISSMGSKFKNRLGDANSNVISYLPLPHILLYS